jgi:hypothetical protein
MGKRDGESSWRGETFLVVLSLAVFSSLLTGRCMLIILFFSPSSYKDKVTDYNFGCLVRSDARGEYGEQNTIFGELVSPLIEMLHANLWSIFRVTRIQVCLSCV